MIDSIMHRLDKTISNLSSGSFVEIFPLILEDLEYILINYKNDKKKLPPDVEFEFGIALTEKIHEYYAKLAKVYVKEIYGMDMNIILENKYSLSGAGGGYNSQDGNMYYSTMGALLATKSDLSFLHTCLHEACHKLQHRVYMADKPVLFPPHMLKILRESLLEESLTENNREFYTSNYTMLFAENDAENFARKNIYNFIDNLFSLYKRRSNKSSIDMMKFLPKVMKIKDAFVKVLRDEEFRLDPEIIQQLYGENMLNGDYTFHNHQVDKLILIDKYIKFHPELQNQYPILRLLFVENRVKNYEEILQDWDNQKRNLNQQGQQKIDALYEEIIRLDPILMITSLLEKNDNQSVRDFIDLHPTIFEEYPVEMAELTEKYGNFYGLNK